MEKDPQICIFRLNVPKMDTTFTHDPHEGWLRGECFQDLQLPGKLSSKLALLSNLEEIRLEYNHLTGEIPESLGDSDTCQVKKLDGFCGRATYTPVN